jgi:hypothetical protein
VPIHDWTRIDANVFHHFHQAWSLAISNALNGGLLPKGYAAFVEQRADGVEPDVIAVEGRGHQLTGGAVTATRPRAAHVMHGSLKRSPGVRGNRVVIRHRLGRVVCVIEIVSPGNKASRDALRQFVDKTIGFLRKGVHVLVIDPLRPSPRRDPQGIHRAIWDRVTKDGFALPPDQPLTLAAYHAGREVTAYVEPVAVGAALPDMPAYLDDRCWVPVPLEATYQAAWTTCPEDMRTYVETGRVPHGD